MHHVFAFLYLFTLLISYITRRVLSLRNHIPRYKIDDYRRPLGRFINEISRTTGCIHNAIDLVTCVPSWKRIHWTDTAPSTRLLHTPSKFGNSYPVRSYLARFFVLGPVRRLPPECILITVHKPLISTALGGNPRFVRKITPR